MQASQQLLEQQHTAAAMEADMTAVAAQLQEQLLKAQADGKEAHAAAKLRQIEHEGVAHQLSKVCHTLDVIGALSEQCEVELSRSLPTRLCTNDDALEGHSSVVLLHSTGWNEFMLTVSGLDRLSRTATPTDSHAEAAK